MDLVVRSGNPADQEGSCHSSQGNHLDLLRTRFSSIRFLAVWISAVEILIEITSRLSVKCSYFVRDSFNGNQEGTNEVWELRQKRIVTGEFREILGTTLDFSNPWKADLVPTSRSSWHLYCVPSSSHQMILNSISMEFCSCSQVFFSCVEFSLSRLWCY